MTGLVQPIPCRTTLLPVLHNESLQSWEDTIKINKALSLSSSGAGGFNWPRQVSSATPVASTPDLSPPMYTQLPMQDTANSTQLQRITISTDSITSKLPQSSMSYRPDVQQPPSKRLRTVASAKQPSLGPEESASHASTRLKRNMGQARRAKSLGATPSSHQGEAGEDEVDEQEEPEKLRMYRERNRIAAAKTRRKKKCSAKELEQRAQDVFLQNQSLKHEERSLRDALSTLRFTALAHDPSNSGCACADIHGYNQRRALEMAQEMAASKSSATRLDLG
ncbi:uncharacterized protein MYCFIDRAFT_212599 [Pseudocercospora fijiensis CIRAD86]|uniref:BZIP domain-containing protein n=1 Tax=Pseudocercospora fijiensis (strain CIRAD86) TaxID=383855 RepID=M3A0L9_PSEFD|nr:uncharacterized protein MYCFIDRAFT_212599 [Pseudocercospora fijiensis CIRAD86]EME77956.1 hypothetical protein MYCFIDRAFT_212599 [Pseudocercospora fijiensis CIRAD86]